MRLLIITFFLLSINLYAYSQAAIKADESGNILIGGNITLNNGATFTNPSDTATITETNIKLDGVITYKSYIRHHDIGASAATVGSTAPTAVTVGTFRGLGFDADNEVAYWAVEVPPEWDEISDMQINAWWYSTAGDIVANGEVVKWDITYRSIAVGEAVDNGNAVTVSDSLVGGAAETDKELYVTSITINYDDSDQPLTIFDRLGIQFDRDVSGESSSYSGRAIVIKWELVYTAIGQPSH